MQWQRVGISDLADGGHRLNVESEGSRCIRKKSAESLSSEDDSNKPICLRVDTASFLDSGQPPCIRTLPRPQEGHMEPALAFSIDQFRKAVPSQQSSPVLALSLSPPRLRNIHVAGMSTDVLTEETINLNRIFAKDSDGDGGGKPLGLFAFAELDSMKRRNTEAVLLKLTDPAVRSHLKPIKTQHVAAGVLCFSGRKAVSCLVKAGFKKTRAEAVDVLQLVHSQGFLRHLSGDVAQFKDKPIPYVLTVKARNLLWDCQKPDRASLCEFERWSSPKSSSQRKDKKPKAHYSDSFGIVDVYKHIQGTCEGSSDSPASTSPRLEIRMDATTSIRKDLLRQQGVFEEFSMRHDSQPASPCPSRRISVGPVSAPSPSQPSRSKRAKLANISGSFFSSHSVDIKSAITQVGEKTAPLLHPQQPRSGIFVSSVDRVCAVPPIKPVDQSDVLVPPLETVWATLSHPPTEDMLASVGKVQILQAPPPVSVPPPHNPRDFEDLLSQFSAHVTAVCFQFPQRCNHKRAFLSSHSSSSSSGLFKSIRSRLNLTEPKEIQEGPKSSKAVFKSTLLSDVAGHTALHWRSYSTVQQTLGLDFSLHCCALRAVILNDVVALEFFAKHVDMSLPVLPYTDGDNEVVQRVLEDWCMRHLSQLVKYIKQGVLSTDEMHLLRQWKRVRKDVEKVLESDFLGDRSIEGSKGANLPEWMQSMVERLQKMDVPLDSLSSSSTLEFSTNSAGVPVPLSMSMSCDFQTDDLRDICTSLRNRATDLIKHLAAFGLRSSFSEWAAEMKNFLQKELSSRTGLETLPEYFTPFEVALALGNSNASAQLIALGVPFKKALRDSDISKVSSAAMALGHFDAWLRLRAVYGNDAVAVSKADLSGLHLAEVPTELASVAASLERVDLTYNNLHVIPTFLASCGAVDVSYNPLTCLPSHVYWDPPTIPSFLSSVKASANAWNTTKVTVLCLTPIAQSIPLLSRIFGLRSATAEIPPQELTILTCSAVGGEVAHTTNVWLVADGPWVHDHEDLLPFGPRLFLTPSSHYVIVFDPSHGEISEELLQFTVRRIKQMEIFYHVFAKMTLLELHHSAESPSLAGMAAARFSNIPFCIVENKDSSILAFQNRLLATLSASHPKTIPESWAHVTHFLSSCQVDFVQREGLHKWFSTCGVPSEGFDELEKFLIRHGIIFGWKAGDALGGHILLDPKCIMHSLNMMRTNKSGIVPSILSKCFHEDDSFPYDISAFSNPRSSSTLSCGVRRREASSSCLDRVPQYVIELLNAHNVLIEIMVQRVLCLYVVPALLPPTIPNISSVWNIKYAQERIRIYRMSFQISFLFQVFLMKILKAKQLPIQHMWKSGTLVNDDHSAVLATITRKSGKTEVTVKERCTSIASSKLFLSVLHILEEVLEVEAQRINVEIVVPCPHCLSRASATPWEFKYDALVSLMSQGCPFAYCEDIERPTRCIQISHMAPDVGLSYFPQINPEDIIEEKVLGKGAFGLVKKCTWKGLDVAVKEHNDDDSENTMKVFKGVLKEATIMSNLRSQFLVRLYGVAPPLRLVMEYVPCGDLYHLLHGKDAVSIHISLQARLILDVARGMQYLQNISPPILHRDLRSPNIFIQSMDVSAPVCAKVADFGLSRQTFGKVQEGLLCWNWLAPEVLRGESYDTKSDMYSFGMIMYEILSGRIPYDEFYDNPAFCREMPLPDGGRRVTLKVQTLKAAILSEGLLPTPPFTSEILAPLAKLMIACWAAEPISRPSFSSAVFVCDCIFNAILSGNDRVQDMNLALLSLDHIKNLEGDPNFPFAKEVTDSQLQRASTIDRLIFEAAPRDESELRASVGDQEYFSKMSEPELFQDVANCFFHNFSLTCMAHVNDQDLWMGSTSGIVVVLSLQTTKVVKKLRLSPSSRVVKICQYTHSVLCVTETGEVHFMDKHTLAKVQTIALSSSIISFAQLSSDGHLWCAFPNDLCLAMWAIRGRLVSGKPTYLRLAMSPDNDLCVQRAQETLENPSAGYTPLCIDCIESRPSATMLGCSGGTTVLLVVLNDVMDVAEKLFLERESGRITAMLSCKDGILVGTYQGLLVWKGQRLFSMQTRVVSISKPSPKWTWTTCFGYDGSMVLLDETMSIVKEFRFSCGKSVLVQSVFKGSELFYGTRDGKVMKVHLKKNALEYIVEAPELQKPYLEEIHQSHPMIEDAWELLELHVAQETSQTGFRQCLQQYAEKTSPQKVTMKFFSICGVEASLPLILHILCLSFDSLGTEKTLAELQHDMALLYQQEATALYLNRQNLRLMERIVVHQSFGLSQFLRDFVESYVKALVKKTLVSHIEF